VTLNVCNYSVATHYAKGLPVMRLDTVDIWQHYLWWQWTGNGRRGCGWDDVEFISEWLSLEVWPLISRHHTTTTHTMHCLSALPVTAQSAGLREISTRTSHCCIIYLNVIWKYRTQCG